MEKETKKVRKHNETTGEKILSFLDSNRKVIYGFVGGALVASLTATIMWPERIAELKDGTQPVAEIMGQKISADSLYENMKQKYDVNFLVEMIDKKILEKKYKETDEMKEEINKLAESYYAQAAQYQMTKEAFLAQYGFKSHDEFIENLKINYLRNKYFDEYVEDLITDKEIENFYEDEVYGDIDSKHMLVEINEDMKDEDARKLADEIISKLNDGKDFDKVKDEYKDKITFENLGYQPFNASIEENYMNALVELKDKEYTKEPVKTSYGYHIIYRIKQKDKPKLKDVKDAIIEELSTEKKNEDKYLSVKALNNLRTENKLKFYDTELEEKYNKVIDSTK